ncbi:MAG: hypothetical protein IJ345_08465 [Clostridia bacterium]|nr:hypothetical protein [Clostridia bacterium]
MKKLFVCLFFIFCIMICSACDEITQLPDAEETTLSENASEETTVNETTAEETTIKEKEVYSFEDLYSISNHIDIGNISSFTVDSFNGTLGGIIMHDVMIASNQEHVNSVIEFINNVEFTRATDLYYGVGTYNITLASDDKTFEFSFSSRNEFYVNGIGYIASIEFPFKGIYDSSYCYIGAREEVKLSSYGNITTLTDFDLSEIHLTEIELDLYAYDYTKDADLIIDGKTVKIISDNLIEIYGMGYYEVVSEKNFSSLIPKNETSSVIKFETDYQRELGCISVSNNVVYTVDEIKEILTTMTAYYDYQIFNSDGTPFVDREFTEDETIIIRFSYNYDDVLSRAGSGRDDRIYDNALNADKLQKSGYSNHLPIYRFDTLNDLEKFKTDFGGEHGFNFGWDEVPSLNDVTAEYDDAFFEEYSLMLVYIDTISGSFRFGVNGMVCEDDYFCILVTQTNDPECFTDDMASWFITVPVLKSKIAGCTEFDAELVHKTY